ncbi:Hpt domain-containing protein [Halarsenatibacter silvermanii]|uniref:HPt (Histidine-containing phosphotransfer) domain-containing protein n=1 Tax=Halarsenatibacter silvermanii TaxID=321763 RepID=A0A1G9S0W5_9FIRM|nr:Hpt domain-containing protein [Halarsenatibacter silvermanii]SDM29131.1 HPt (histidine-containing phosphotransfer) domain-containing protein [Halarsenatibacter silvermanii]
MGENEEVEKNIVHVDEDLKELIPMFLENRRQNIEDLQKLLAEKNYEEIEKLGHKIKGSGGGYGFDRVTELGRDIEEAAAAEDHSSLQKSIEELAEYMEGVEIVYE